MKGNEILRDQPGTSRKQFIYNIKRANFTKEWGPMYERPSIGVRILTFFFRLLPRFGPFKGFGYKVPTPQVERMFEDSFDAAIKRDRESLANADSGRLRLTNRDLDTGKLVSPGEYVLTDRSYDSLLKKLADKKFETVTPELRTNILNFYASMKTPDPHGIDVQLAALKAFSPAAD